MMDEGGGMKEMLLEMSGSALNSMPVIPHPSALIPAFGPNAGRDYITLHGRSLD